MNRTQELASQLDDLLAEFTPLPTSDRPRLVQKAIYLARQLQERAAELQTPQEKRQQLELDRMMQSASDKVTLTQLTDQAFRSEEVARSADQLIHILDVQGIPRFFTPLDRTLLKGFQSFGNLLPGVAVPLVKDHMRRETANVILPAEPQILSQHLEERRREGVRMNVNYLGEAILGEAEAERRLQQYLDALKLPRIEVVSVKISTVFSQINPIDREDTIATLCDRMEQLYRAANAEQFVRADGTTVPKFVYLDMEEYRDASLTAEVFMRTLSRAGLEQTRAGVALQAYIPDSFSLQKQITVWARERVAGGGAPVTIRVVKGANMEMERVEASLHEWPQAPFQHKVETDANYKRMLQYGLHPDNRDAVRLGIASHNLFDVAYGLVLAHDQLALGNVQFEMLEGMANHQRRALHELTQNMLLYAPACYQEQFINAIGYLIRRLDENTGPQNFLRHAFNITVDSTEWLQLEKGFVEAFQRIPQLPEIPRRQQDRRNEQIHRIEPAAFDWQQFINEPDTDFSLPQNAEWANDIIERWLPRHGDNAVEIPLHIAGHLVSEDRTVRESLDPSRPGTVVARYQEATSSDVNVAVACAKADPAQWRQRSCLERCEILANVAAELRNARADLMGAAIADGGKTLLESDPEVSEAIDFVEFYARAAKYFDHTPGVDASGRGVVAVVSPWNFPIAIPCGGVVAALAAGNTVILKPASNAVLVACELCDCFYRGGVPRQALQLLPCSGGEGGRSLVTHPDVDVVILTGGTETAVRMLDDRPEMNLLAETGGKNATIVTALADRDQAIKHVLHSAFGHSGQKCSATSLLLLEDEIFDDEDFRSALADAVASLSVGSAWDLTTRMGPVITPPKGDLLRGLTQLEEGEEWALQPQQCADNPCLWTPGIKWNVQPQSDAHCTEYFGPVLSVMKFRRLTEAIDLVNSTGFGLTSGLESLDDREQDLWQQSIRAGNLYINRGTTGAIVLRQPFGGMGKSAFGPGIKAGGPNYVMPLMQFTQTAPPECDGNIEASALSDFVEAVEEAIGEGHFDVGGMTFDMEELRTAVASFDYHAQQEFNREHDHFRLIGQDNIRRYLPVGHLRIRLHADDSWPEALMRIAAARAAGCHITVSVEPASHWAEFENVFYEITESWAGEFEFVEETDDELCRVITARQTDRLRYAHRDRVPESVRQAVVAHCIYVADAPVMSEGRIELLWYVQEQSLSSDYHRYGNLGSRTAEQRAEPA